MDSAPYTVGATTRLGGSAQADAELLQFIWVLTTYTPDAAVPMAPIGVRMDHDSWQVAHLADGASYGHVIPGLWKVGIAKKERPKRSDTEGSTCHLIGTLRGRYTQCVNRQVGDSRGVVDTAGKPNIVGLEVWIRDGEGDRRLSLNICMRILSLGDVRYMRWNWPRGWDDCDRARELTGGGKRTTSGTTKWSVVISESEPFKTDIFRRSTPLRDWGAIVGEISDTMVSGEKFGPLANTAKCDEQIGFDAAIDV